MAVHGESDRETRSVEVHINAMQEHPGASLPSMCVCVTAVMTVGFRCGSISRDQCSRSASCVCLEDLQKQVQLTNSDYVVAVGATLLTRDYNF